MKHARAASAVDTYLRHKGGNKVELRGILKKQELLPLPGKTEDSAPRYSLQLENNVEVPLKVTAANGRIMAALTPNTVVLASGTQVPAGSVTLTSVDTQGELPPLGLHPITPDPATQRGPTARKVLVIPVIYDTERPGHPENTISQSQIQNQLEGPGDDSMASIFRDSSAGTQDPVPATGGDLSFDITYHAPAVLGGTRPTPDEGCEDNRTRMTAAGEPSRGISTSNVNKKIGIDPMSPSYGDYDHYLYLFECTDPRAWGASGVPGQEVVFFSYSVFDQNNPGWPGDIFGHEMGHALGVSHDNLYTCTSAGIPSPSSADTICDGLEYAAPNDMMGSTNERGGLLTAQRRVQLGFIPTMNTVQARPAEGQTYSFASSTTRFTNGARQLVQVPRPNATLRPGSRPGDAWYYPEDKAYFYYLSIRSSKNAYDSLPANSPLSNGVTIIGARGLDDGGERNTWTVQTHPLPDTDADRNPREAVGDTRPVDAHTLLPGRSFFDPRENYTITTSNVSTGGAVATVRVEPGPPRSAPTSASVVGRRLIVRAGDGSFNNVSIKTDGSSLVVADFGNVVTPGNSCVRTTADVQVARCNLVDFDFVDVLLGDKDDQGGSSSNVTKPVTFDGGAGDDTIVAAGSGADILRGGLGQDFLDPSGSGFDTVSFADLTTPVALDSLTATPWIVVNADGNDEIATSGTGGDRALVPFEQLIGGSGNDTLRWLAQPGSARTIVGGPGVDRAVAPNGNATINTRDGVTDNASVCGIGTNVVDRDDADSAGSTCTRGPVGVTITGGVPEGATAGASSPPFVFRSYKGTATNETFQCKLEPATTFTSCPQSYAIASLTAGPKVLSVRAVVSGTASASSVVRRFNVDKTAPTVTLTAQPPAYDTNRYATFAFSSSENTGRFTCRLDGVDSACQSPVHFKDLSEATHTFAVRAIDEAGNASAFTTALSWSVARTLPDTAITGGPEGTTTSPAPTFAFGVKSGSPVAAGYQCRVIALDAGVFAPPAFAACSGATSHVPATALTDGRYRFEVRARNASGGYDLTPETLEFNVISQGGLATLSGGTLTVTAAAGKASRVLVRAGASNTFTIEDQFPLRSDACIQVTVRRITCSAAGITTIVVDGGDGNDRIDANVPVATTLRGGTGDDVLRGAGLGADTFVGGDGSDTVTYGNVAVGVSVSLDGVANDGPAGTTTKDAVGSDIELVIGTPVNDTLSAGTTAAMLDGGRGNDTITLGSTTGFVYDAPGNDVFYGGAWGHVIIDSEGDDTYNGGTGNDAVYLSDQPGNDTINGGAGTDEVIYAWYTRGVSVTLDGVRNDGPAPSATDSDQIASDNEVLVGGSGSDILTGLPSTVRLTGNEGNDLFYVKSTPTISPIVEGGPGTDSLSMRAVAAPITVNVNGLPNTASVKFGTLAPSPVYSVETYRGGTAADTMSVTTDSASDQRVTFDGGDGNDALTAGRADDVLLGGNGGDTLIGGPGEDLISAGDGADTIYAKDGFADGIVCGSGTPDDATIDSAIDTTDEGCEAFHY